MEMLTEKELDELFVKNTLHYGEIEMHNEIYVIENLQYGQIALQVVESEHRNFKINDTSYFLPTYVFYDEGDGSLKGFNKNGEKTNLIVVKDTFEVKYIILDLEIK